jgi:hypothetical protein
MVYTKVDDAVNAIMAEGRGALLAKIDIRDAYRIIPIHADDRFLLGMVWRGNFFVDLALPFGLRSAPFIFNQFATALHWILQHVGGLRWLFHYLDDFLMVGAPNSAECQSNLDSTRRLASSLGVPLAEEKVEGPLSCLTFLGIELDTVDLTARLPQDKLGALKDFIALWSDKRVCRRKELESLLGHLYHAAKVVYPGRPFLRRLTNLLQSPRHNSIFLRLNSEARQDIRWWSQFLETWNGVSFLTFPEWLQVADLQISTDAAGAVGYGAYLDGCWFAGRWIDWQVDCSIAYKELFPIVLAAHVWGPLWQGKRVCFLCDNKGVSEAVQRRSCHEAELGGLLRSLFLAAARHSFWVSSTHIPGRLNNIADALSRFQFQRFRSLAPDASPSPVYIPRQLLEQLSSRSSVSVPPT